MTFAEMLVNRRSIRKYQEKEIPLEMIHSIINDSILAPSSGNEQPWKFIIIRNKELINRLSNEGKKNMLERIASNPNDYVKIYEKMLRNESFHIFYHAPAVIYILGEESLRNVHVDCALAASYFMMSATSKGLGTCWVNFGKIIKDPEIISALGITESHTIVAPIALGYPEKIPSIPFRKDPQILSVIE